MILVNKHDGRRVSAKVVVVPGFRPWFTTRSLSPGRIAIGRILPGQWPDWYCAEATAEEWAALLTAGLLPSVPAQVQPEEAPDRQHGPDQHPHPGQAAALRLV